jgi:hypothetical protein
VTGALKRPEALAPLVLFFGNLGGVSFWIVTISTRISRRLIRSHMQYWKAPRETSMAAFRIDLLHRSDEHREQRHDLYAPDIDAAVVQARALFRALSPGKPSLVSFRIMENGLIAYEASKGDLG